LFLSKIGDGDIYTEEVGELWTGMLELEEFEILLISWLSFRTSKIQFELILSRLFRTAVVGGISRHRHSNFIFLWATSQSAPIRQLGLNRSLERVGPSHFNQLVSCPTFSIDLPILLLISELSCFFIHLTRHVGAGNSLAVCRLSHSDELLVYFVRLYRRVNWLKCRAIYRLP